MTSSRPVCEGCPPLECDVSLEADLRCRASSSSGSFLIWPSSSVDGVRVRTASPTRCAGTAGILAGFADVRSTACVGRVGCEGCVGLRGAVGSVA